MGIVIPWMLQSYGMSDFVDKGMEAPVTGRRAAVARLVIGDLNISAVWIIGIRKIRIGATGAVLIVGAEPDDASRAEIRYFLESDVRDFRPCRQSGAHGALLCSAHRGETESVVKIGVGR